MEALDKTQTPNAHMRTPYGFTPRKGTVSVSTPHNHIAHARHISARSKYKGRAVAAKPRREEARARNRTQPRAPTPSYRATQHAQRAPRVPKPQAAPVGRNMGGWGWGAGGGSSARPFVPATALRPPTARSTPAAATTAAAPPAAAHRRPPPIATRRHKPPPPAAARRHPPPQAAAARRRPLKAAPVGRRSSWRDLARSRASWRDLAPPTWSRRPRPRSRATSTPRARARAPPAECSGVNGCGVSTNAAGFRQRRGHATPANLVAAGSSGRGGGSTPRGPASSPWEWARAAQSRQARLAAGACAELGHWPKEGGGGGVISSGQAAPPPH